MEAVITSIAPAITIDLSMDNYTKPLQTDIKGPNLIKGVHLEGLRVIGCLTSTLFATITKVLMS